MDGRAIGILGLALCMMLCGAGSALGLYKTGASAAGVLAEDGKKFCGHCGAENPADNKFCKSCGAKLD